MKVIIVALLTMLVAQGIKLPIYYFKTGIWDSTIIFSTGSMPSSHSAVVIATVLEIGVLEGYSSSLFGLSCVFAAIVIHDAIKVRGETGKQAKQINELSDSLKNIQEIMNFKNENEVQQAQLKELIGHTSSEVIGGIMIGIIIFGLCNLI